MLPTAAIAVICEILNLIGSRKFEAAVGACASSRLSANDLARIIDEYVRTPVRVPDEIDSYLDVVQISGGVLAWSVRVPLWTQEEGRSDLTVELTLELSDSEIAAELDDLRVL